MKHFRNWLASLLLVAGIGFVVAPNAHAGDTGCTGIPSCDSGWQATVYHDANDSGVDITVSQRVVWNADDFSRTVYFSGHYCVQYTGDCHRMDEVRLYYAVPGSGVWWQWWAHSPGPNYGYAWWFSFTPSHNDSHVHGWMVKFRYDTFWVKAPIIYN